MSHRRLALGLFGAAAGVGMILLLFLSSPAGAEIGPFTWTVHDRADATTFVPSTTTQTLPGTGYEIVSFTPALPSAGVAPYVYGGLDLPASLGGPLAESLVTCAIDFEAGTLKMSVVGAFPYSGCVFFLGVSAPANETQTFDLKLLPNVFDVMCDTPGCEASDVELLFGGTTNAEVEALCLPLNDPAGNWENAGDLYTVPGDVTVVCPMFVTVAQAANEGTVYEVWIIPPETPLGDTDFVVADTTPVISSVGMGLAAPDATGISQLFTWVFVLLLVAAITLFGFNVLRKPRADASTAPQPGMKGQRPSGKGDR